MNAPVDQLISSIKIKTKKDGGDRFFRGILETGMLRWRVREQSWPNPAPFGSLDILPRSRSLLQTKMAAAPSKRTSLENPTENKASVDSLSFSNLFIFQGR